jgi:MFS transporter, DHA1 family, tetracycline resistance protein
MQATESTNKTPTSEMTPGAAPGAVTKLNGRQLALLAFTMLVAMLTLTLPVAQLDQFVSRLLPGGGADLALENTAKGLFSTAHFAAYIPFAFIWGALSDRRGKRKPYLLLGLVGQGIMYAFIPLMPNIWLLYAARFIEGTFSIAVVSMLMTMAVDMAPANRRGMTLGIFTLGMLIGNAVGAPLGGVLSTNMGYAAPFFLGTVLLFGIAVVVALFVRDTPSLAHAYRLRESLAVLRTNPRLYVPYAFSLLDRLTVGFFVGQFPVLATEIYGLKPSQTGAYLAAFLACFALFSPLGGLLSDRLGRVYPMLLGTVVYGLMLMLVGRVGPEMLYVVMMVGGLSGAVLYPPSIALVGDYAGPSQRGVAMGGFNLAGSIGFAAGPLLFSLIADASGLLASPLVAGGLCLLAAAVAAPLLLRRERASLSPQQT